MYLLDLKENRNILIIFDSNGSSADSAVSNFPLMVQIALITQTLTTDELGSTSKERNIDSTTETSRFNLQFSHLVNTVL